MGEALLQQWSDQCNAEAFDDSDLDLGEAGELRDCQRVLALARTRLSPAPTDVIALCLDSDVSENDDPDLRRDDLESWARMTREEQRAALARREKAFRDRRAQLEAQFPLPDIDAWLERVEQLAPAGWSYAIATRSTGLPSVDEASALIILSASSASAPTGLFRWSARRGMFGAPTAERPKIELFSQEGALAPDAARSLARACKSAERHGLQDIPAKCYDGLACALAMRCSTAEHVFRGSCNLADAGREITRRLARLVHGVPTDCHSLFT